MPTPEDRALAEALHRVGKLSRERLEALLAELDARPGSKLVDLLTPEDTGGSAGKISDAPKIAPPPPLTRGVTIRPTGPSANVIPGDPMPLEPAPTEPEPPPAPVKAPPAPESRPAMAAVPGGELPRAAAPHFPAPPAAGDTAIRRRAKVLRRFGRFDLHEELGRGGLGVVYRATDNASKRPVAIRILTPGTTGADSAERLLRDAKAATPPAHPNIVALLETGEVDGEIFLVTDLVEGTNAESLLLERGALPPRLALEIARDAARGLGAAHRAGIVHRDITPGCILLERIPSDTPGAVRDDLSGASWRVRVADFGMAREAGKAVNLGEGAPMGTPTTMSPEAARGLLTTVDARSDVYSMGSVLYRMLTGVQPFPGNSIEELGPLIIASEPEPLEERRPGLHRDLGLIVSKAMAREPRLRFRTANELAEDVDRYLKGEAIRALPPGAFHRVRRLLGRHLLAAAAVLFCLVSLAAAAGWTVWQGRARDLDRRRDAVARESAGLAALQARAWDDAIKEFDAALTLDPTLSVSLHGREEARLGHFLGDVRRLLDAHHWEGALALIAATPIEWRGRPEIAAQERLARGTASLEITADGAWDVDIVEAEPGVAWDEETFPSVQEARESGLSKLLGSAPIAPVDHAPGEVFVIWSREGRIGRVVPIELGRSAAVHADFRVVPLVAGADVRGALKALLPGAVVELASGNWIGGWSLPPGLLLRPAPGARVVLGAPEGASALLAAGAFGVSVRDLELAGGRETAILASRSGRFSAARCRLRDFDNGGAWIEGGSEGVLRELVLERVGGQAIRLAGEGHRAIDCRIEDAGWAGITLGGPDCAAIRNTIRGTQRAGIQGIGGARLLIRDNDIQDCPEWGILVTDSPASIIRDNTCIDCASAPASSDAAAITAVGDCEIRHNTVTGGGDGIQSRENPRPLADNLVAFCGGTGITLRSRNCDVFDYNLIWKCREAGAILDQKAATLEILQTLQPALNLRQMQKGVEADPRFLDRANHNLRLAANSPARDASFDGSEIGARLKQRDEAPARSSEWLQWSIGQMYLDRGRSALASTDREQALPLLLRARLLLGNTPEIAALIGEKDRK